jgi:rare lipoprotein A
MKKALVFILLFNITQFTMINCSSALRYNNSNNHEDADRFKTGNNNQPIDTIVLETKTGTASYYSKKFDGKKTTSGEIYNMNDLTAAHPKYPFGTMVKVTNLSNNNSVIVKINDRPPKKFKRSIDLSLEAAKQLDMIRAGVVKVRLEVLKWGK